MERQLTVYIHCKRFTVLGCFIWAVSVDGIEACCEIYGGDDVRTLIVHTNRYRQQNSHFPTYLPG